MSLITHRCTECGHPDFWRLGRPGELANQCSECGCRCAPGQPEVIPTFNLASQPVERIVPPGKPLTAGVPTCGCAACKALHKQLTAV